MQPPHPNRKNHNGIASGMDDVVKSEGEGGKQKNRDRGERGKVISKLSEWLIQIFANASKSNVRQNVRNYFHVDVSQHGRHLQKKKPESDTPWSRTQ